MSAEPLVFRFTWDELGDILLAHVAALRPLAPELAPDASVFVNLNLIQDGPRCIGVECTVSPLPNVTVLDTKRGK